MDRIRSRMGFEYGFYMNRRNKGSGLTLLWKKELNLIVESYSEGHIDSTILMVEDRLLWKPSSEPKMELMVIA